MANVPGFRRVGTESHAVGYTTHRTYTRGGVRVLCIYVSLQLYFSHGIAAGVARNLERIWKAKDISKETKVLVYRSLVQSILLYNAETWTLKEENKRSLRVFEMAIPGVF